MKRKKVNRDKLRLMESRFAYTEEMRVKKNQSEPIPEPTLTEPVFHHPDGTAGGGRRVIRSPRGLS